jgi:hypothetical protein
MRALKVGLALLVSGGAFAALWAVGTMELGAPSVAEASIEPEPAPVEPAPAGVVATADDGPPLVLPDELPEPPAEEPPAPSGVEVPDLSGMTALRAFRLGRELGFVVDVRDREGRRVPPSERLYMRVMDDAQTPAPGSFAEGGATIRLTARYPSGGGFAAGY